MCAFNKSNGGSSDFGHYTLAWNEVDILPTGDPVMAVYDYTLDVRGTGADAMYCSMEQNNPIVVRTGNYTPGQSAAGSVGVGTDGAGISVDWIIAYGVNE
jgi:hypothetical protein